MAILFFTEENHVKYFLIVINLKQTDEFRNLERKTIDNS